MEGDKRLVVRGEKLLDVVYVEDDPRIRQMYRINLEADGFVVREAENGEEALRLVEQKIPDIVLADVFMPRMDGVTMAENLRQSMGMDLPIVFLSANPMSIEEDLLRALGDDYIRKPFSPLALGNRLREVLRKRALIGGEH